MGFEPGRFRILVVVLIWYLDLVQYWFLVSVTGRHPAVVS